MRFMGIFGMIAILAIGYFLSNNKKAIKPRVILWGLGLQLLFAIIILSQTILSWIGMFVFAFLILLFLFEDTLLTATEWHKTIVPSLIALVAGIALTLFSYLLDKFGAAIYLFWAAILIFIVLLSFRKTQILRYPFAVAQFASLGIIFQRQILGKAIFAALADKVDKFLKLTDLGSVFLFGNLAKPEYFDKFGFQFAFSVLPTIIFFSAVMSILYYLGVMQAVVQVMARFMRWTMGTSGAETLSCSSNIFVGQTEAPLLIRPFLDDMTRSELHAIMVGGFATIAGGVLAGYIRMGINAGHLIAASVMSAPAALVMAKIFFPETEHSKTAGDVEIPDVSRADNLLDAATRGVTDGLKLAVNVGAMLLAFIALIGLVDVIFGFFDHLIDGRLLGGVLNQATGEYSGIFPGSLKTLLGTIFAPLAFLMGVPWKEAMDVGNLLGIKIAVNEFVGYAELAKQISAASLSPRSIIIATYALCGFANFSSIGIQIGGISALAPKRRSDLSKIALRAMFAGALASWMTATIAGMLV
ncbi:MAG: NupC/NupG family nucleoside CNT transporter [Calditrichaeota bacterium]|nr:NupC/NupG family nucleoside CNT transporter [Calditrichota bacterium]